MHSTQLKTHENKHTGVKPNVCGICGRKFFSAAALYHHGEICGVKVKSFHCNTCKRAFKSRKYLREHERIHASTVVLACEVCGKVYRHRSSLFKHTKTHVG